MASKTDDELSSSKDDGLSSSISKNASLQITSSVASPPAALTPDVLSPTQDLRTQASESLEASESLLPLAAENCAGTLAGPPEKNNMKPAPESQLHGSGAEHCAGTLVGPPAMDNMVSAPTTQLFHGRDTEISTLPHGTLGTDPTMASPAIEASKQALPQANAPSEPIQGASPSQFVPSLGSWAKPLFFKPPVTPPGPSTPKGYDPVIVGNQLAALWPSLNDEILNKQPKKLSPQSRNLFRAATPTYRLDGTPEVSIPSKVLRLGPENKDEYVIGKFHKCSLPPGGLVHAVVNKIWGRSCKISCKKLDNSSYMFHIPHQPTRHWIIQRGVWHIDDCLLFVLPWTPEGTFKILEVSTLPVWVNLKNVLDCCYSRLGISHVASGRGEPILTHKPRLDPTSRGEAKVLVEMKLDRDFPKLIALDDKQDSIYLVNVEYTWIPSTCERCGSLGHNAKICLLPRKLPEDSNSLAKSVGVNDDILVVNIDLILQQEDNVVSSSSTSQQKEASAQVSLPAASLTCGVLNIQNQFKDLDVLPAASVSEVTIITKDVSRSHSGLETETPSLYVSSNTSMDCQDTQVAGYKTISSSSQIQEENQIALPSLPKIFSPLVDSQSALTSTHIMDSCPSKIISSEDHKFSVVDLLTTTLLASAFESPSRFTVLGNVDETDVEPMGSLGLTRGGRETKPPIKYQDLEWKTPHGRGKHGRRGRGSNH